MIVSQIYLINFKLFYKSLKTQDSFLRFFIDILVGGVILIK